jgi:hypothetical protein
MVKKNNQTTLVIRRVIEYGDFFVGEDPIDISATLKRFSRNTLVRMAAVLSLHYGNMCWPDAENTLFSVSSKKHIPYLNKLFKAYYNKLGLTPDRKVELLTYRTSLELWRQIFAIHVDEFQDKVEEEDVELILFKVVLSINEKIVGFTERDIHYKPDELIFLNSFLTNDSNNYDYNAVLQPQLYYFYQLINFIPSNEVLKKATEILFKNWGISSWQQYYTTIFVIAHETDKYIQRKGNGVPIITLDWIERNQRFLSLSLIEQLFIDEEEYIPFNDDDAIKKDWNIDYRRFRSKPFVKLKDGSGYVVVNNQLVCERLYNSLFFDFSPLINGQKKSCGLFDYNKGFVEKYLFRNTFFNCIPTNCFTFPIKGDETTPEKPKEPDFYARTKKGELIIVECKAIKMNGECRDDGDYRRLLEELHEKIVRKTKNLDPTRKEYKGSSEPIGVGQLINHIDSIEAGTFQWDNEIPDEVYYYPLLVFEDIKMVHKGILSMVNRWFYEDVKKEEWKELDLANISCMPIMVVSINTLYLYDSLLLKRGLTKVINAFVSENASYDTEIGWYKIFPMADFDEYLRKNKYNKRGDMIKWHKNLLRGLEE